jgi:hypothetical protein
MASVEEIISELWTVSAVANQLRLAQSTVRTAVETGKLRSFKTANGLPLCVWRDVEDWNDSRPRHGGRPIKCKGNPVKISPRK